MRKAYVFRLYPTDPQQVRLAAMLAAHCELYNAALEERREAYRKCGITVKVAAQMAQLTGMRAARPDQAVWSFTSQQQTLRRLDKAFAAFFRRLKAGEKPGYPRFRSVRRFDSVDFRHGDGITFGTKGRSKGHAGLRVQGIGVVKIRQHRPLPENAKLGQITIKREGAGPRARWYVVIPVEAGAVPLPETGREIGIDLGVVHLATLSEPIPAVTDEHGHLANPRHLAASADRLATAQQAYARTRRGSNRRRKAAQRIGALHAKVARQRRDHAHKTARALVTNADLLVMEDLRTVNMIRRPAPRPDGNGGHLPNGAAAKAGLNRSILDAGWGVFTSVLESKAEEAGRVLLLVNPTNTSRTCAQCGHCDAVNRTSQAVFACVACNHTTNADVNAAINILRAGTVRRSA
ncbi:RNA-guided endonuclease InsQ/TnpB family protein [Streptosporangium canum]|uniref:RNA-guided endonuclease InsQ/TnpB family protein n=1 Tax=Streptosporangium canum TaxID=324952 RepID=UPI0036C0D571